MIRVSCGVMNRFGRGSEAGRVDADVRSRGRQDHYEALRFGDHYEALRFGDHYGALRFGDRVRQSGLRRGRGKVKDPRIADMVSALCGAHGAKRSDTARNSVPNSDQTQFEFTQTVLLTRCT